MSEVGGERGVALSAGRVCQCVCVRARVCALHKSLSHASLFLRLNYLNDNSFACSPGQQLQRYADAQIQDTRYKLEDASCKMQAAACCAARCELRPKQAEAGKLKAQSKTGNLQQATGNNN